MVKATRDEDELAELEEWVRCTPEQMREARQQRRRAAAAALGVRVEAQP